MTSRRGERASRRTRRRAFAAPLAVAVLVAPALITACSDKPAEPPPAATPLFPADYSASYEEVRSCRKSGDHELDFVRVLADPNALGPYLDRATAFPDGAVVLKEQYDVSDTDCSGSIVSWTVMKKHAIATERLGWDWQRVDTKRRVTEANSSRCVGCHASCTGTPEVGYDYTCEEP